MKYFKKYKEYRKLTKFKRRQYKDNLVNMLDEAMDKDPQKAWKLINKSKRKSIPTDHIEKINHQKWFDHFNNLLKSETNSIDHNKQNHVRAELSDYESRPQTGRLDYMISENEIHLAAKSLKITNQVLMI